MSKRIIHSSDIKYVDCPIHGEAFTKNEHLIRLWLDDSRTKYFDCRIKDRHDEAFLLIISGFYNTKKDVDVDMVDYSRIQYLLHDTFETPNAIIVFTNKHDIANSRIFKKISKHSKKKLETSFIELKELEGKLNSCWERYFGNINQVKSDLEKARKQYDELSEINCLYEKFFKKIKKIAEPERTIECLKPLMDGKQVRMKCRNKISPHLLLTI